jgi:hypothetical protein
MKREEQTIKVNKPVPAQSNKASKTDKAEERATGKGSMQDAVAAEFKIRSKTLR